MVTQSIVPAVIPLSGTHLEARLHEVREVVRSVQIDVMDGTYTDTVSWPYVGHEKDSFEAIRREDAGLPYWQELDLEIDLMVRDPATHIPAWALAGASRVIVHVESTDNVAGAIAECKDRRLEVALAIMPDTPLEQVGPHLSDIVFVQCMGSRQIGRQGVTLDPKALDTIKALHAQWPELLIGVDIGVGAHTLCSLYDAGARRFAAGSAVYGAGDPAHAVRDLKKLIASFPK